MKSANTTINSLVQASLEKFDTWGIRKYISPAEEAKLTSGLEYYAHTYLYRHPKDIANGILTDAWTTVFLINGDKNFKEFVGATKLHYYTSFLMRRAIITASTLYSNKHSRETSFSDYSEYDLNLRSNEVRRVDSDYIEFLESTIAGLRSRVQDITDAKVMVKNSEVTLKKLNEEIDALTESIAAELGEVKFTPKSDLDFDSLTQDTFIQDDEEYSTIEYLASALTDDELLTFVGLFSDISCSDLSTFLGHSIVPHQNSIRKKFGQLFADDEDIMSRVAEPRIVKRNRNLDNAFAVTQEVKESIKAFPCTAIANRLMETYFEPVRA